MKIYNAYGYLIVLGYFLACLYVGAPQWGYLDALAISGAYFILVWFFGGLYLADILHLGIAHRSLQFRGWFTKAVTLFTNTFGIYVDPTGWVNRHRLHHKYSDHAGDPNKHTGDGLWRTLWLCLFPYPCKENVATDEIFHSWTFRLTSSYVFALPAQLASFCLLWLLVRSFWFALVMWVGIRVFALWVNMIQNYWTHTRIYGYRRYDDAHDNAMNIGEWFPVWSTFSACLQNNHHHAPSMLRLSHSDEEHDFGFFTIRVMKSLGLVKATSLGSKIPEEVELASLGFG